MCVCACECVYKCVWVSVLYVCVFVSVCVYVPACAHAPCVCVYIHTYIHICIHTHKHVCVDKYFRKTKYSQQKFLHCLCHSACSQCAHVLTTGEGLIVQKNSRTPDGLMNVFATNLFGHYVLVSIIGCVVKAADCAVSNLVLHRGP